MVKEIIDVYDADFKLIGKEERNEAHRKGLWHQSFHCWIIKPNRKIVVQLRSKTKSSTPGLLDVSSAGHILTGEKIEDGIREIKEELGIDIPFESLTYLSYFKWATDKGSKTIIPYHNREFCHTFFVLDDTPISKYKLQPEEVDGVFEIDFSNGQQLFDCEVSEIKIKGYLRKDDNILEKTEMIVTTKDFTKYNAFWLKIFNLAEDFLNNRKYLVI